MPAKLPCRLFSKFNQRLFRLLFKDRIFSKNTIKTASNFPRQLYVRDLIFTNRHLTSSVDQNIRTLQTPAR